MTAPIRSRLSEYAGDDGLGPVGSGDAGAGAPPSRLRELARAAPPLPAAGDDRPGPRPGVPPYRTPVFVPAHPRSVRTTDAAGRAVRAPFIVCELFAHPEHGTVAYAFTGLDRLVAGLGEAQPWVAASLGPLSEGLGGQGVTVLLDPRVAPGSGNWRPADLAAYAREVRG